MEPQMQMPQNRIMPVLVVVLIVASFFIGSLYTKVQYLEKGGAVAGAQAPTNGAAAPAAPEVPAAPVDIDLTGVPFLGSPNAKVAIVEFTDFQCPFCGQLFTNTFPDVKKNYIDSGKIKYYVMNFPLTSIHPYAQKAAEAAECALEQGKFWEMHDKMFANQTALAITDLKNYASQVGMNTASFNDCLDGGKMAAKVSASTKLGESSGVRGTPASFVGTLNGNKLHGSEVSGAVPFATFKDAIDKAL